MSDIRQLQRRALEIRRRYAEFEKKRGGKEWSNKDLVMGFVVDIGELIEIIMAKEGARDLDNMDEKLRHELADCLWCIFILADKYGVDIEAAFLKTMDDLDIRLDKAKL